MLGKVIAQYRIVARLGEGGMGVVYKAEDESLGRTVALKFLPPGSAAGAEERARLVREARAAAALLHPGICPVYEIGQADGQSFIAMAYLEGQSLADSLAAGPLAADKALAVACQVGEALAAAHAKGIVHRDIKPANVMLTEDDRAVLMDFGVAMVSGTTRLTQVGTALGTMAYMAPEQVRGEAVDARCDIWALGVMLYEMVTGRMPFKGEYHAALVYAILNEEPIPLAADGPDLAAGLNGVLTKALAKNPDRRYQRVADLVADLRDLAADPAALPQGTARATRYRASRWRSWSPAARMGIVLGPAALVGVAIWLALQAWPGAAGIDSLGVLPLQNLSGDAAQDLWAQGVTEQLSASIGTIAALKVVSDQTMKQFKDSSDPLPVIGRKVGVKGLVDGSVQVVGEEIQITVKLYDAGEDRMIWSQTYRRPVRDILGVQGEIASAIAGQVEAALTPDESARLAASPQVDPEAYKAFLMGWNSLHDAVEGSVGDAIASFRRATTIDPTYADAFAGLARGHWWNVMVGDASPAEELPLVRAAAEKALDLDPGNARAHVMLADLLMTHDWDWAGAEREFRRAIELNPSAPDARAELASLLTVIGRGDEAIAEARQSAELDPLNGYWAVNYGWNLLYNRRFEEAVGSLKSTLRLNPEFAVWAYNHLAWAYGGLGRGDEACAAYDSALSLAPDFAFMQLAAAATYGRFGREEDAREALANVMAMGSERYIDPYMLCAVWDGLGDLDRAAALLEQSYAEKSPSIWGLSVELFSDEFRADPRFQAVLARMNYPQF